MKSIFRAALVLTISLATFGCWFCERNPIAFKKIEQGQAANQQACVLVFDKAGQYTLSQDITTDYCAIEVTASGVEIDFNGHTLYGPDKKDHVSYGVMASEKSDVKIKNGNIDGFYYGVLITSKDELNITISGNQVSNMNISNSSFRGIYLSGHGSIAAFNKISNTGPAYVYPDSYSFGIELYGTNCVAANNEVVDTYGSESPGHRIGEGVAISFSHMNNGCLAEANLIYNNRMVSNKSTFGFWVDVYSAVTLKDNSVNNMHYSGIVPPATVFINNTTDIPFAHGIYDRN